MLQQTDLKRILTETTAPALSLYLNVNPGYQENQAVTPEWRIWLKNALRDTEAGLSDRDALRDWKPLREQAEAFFETYRPTGRGLVLFISGEQIESYELPLPVANQIHYGEPLVTPLFWVLDEYERYLIVLVDQQEARFFTAYIGSAGEQERMEIDLDEYDFRQKTLSPGSGGLSGSMITQGSNREAYEDMIGEHRSRFYREVVDRIAALSAEHGTERIILGGSESAHAVRNLMPDTLSKLIVDVLPIPLRAAAHDITALVQPTAEAFERQQEDALIAQVIDFAKAGGRGALGRKAVFEALEQQRVELLIAPYPLDDAELEHSLPLRALESSSTLELVHGEAAERLRAEGGIAARLYYAITPVS